MSSATKPVGVMKGGPGSSSGNGTRSRGGLSDAINKVLGLVDLRLVRASRLRRQATEEHERRQLLAMEDYLLDVLRFSLQRFDPKSCVRLRIVTDHPIALQSADHSHPRGARDDNTRHPRFATRCTKLFGKSIFHLDLGCAGGGLVWDFLMAGHQSYGVEGSDYPANNLQAFWRVIPWNLFTADITRPFHFLDEEGSRQRFHLVTAWEVLEHLPRNSLPGLFENLRLNLSDDGLFVASVATFRDEEEATVWHVTVEPRRWWIERFEGAGFELVEGVFDLQDYVRGAGNPRADDWDEASDPSRGFHLVVRKKTTATPLPASQ